MVEYDKIKGIYKPRKTYLKVRFQNLTTGETSPLFTEGMRLPTLVMSSPIEVLQLNPLKRTFNQFAYMAIESKDALRLIVDIVPFKEEENLF